MSVAPALDAPPELSGEGLGTSGGVPQKRALELPLGPAQGASRARTDASAEGPHGGDAMEVDGAAAPHGGGGDAMEVDGAAVAVAPLAAAHAPHGGDAMEGPHGGDAMEVDSAAVAAPHGGDAMEVDGGVVAVGPLAPAHVRPWRSSGGDDDLCVPSVRESHVEGAVVAQAVRGRGFIDTEAAIDSDHFEALLPPEAHVAMPLAMAPALEQLSLAA
ncbi:hypothetical protein T484DRAFT_1911663, partial [Baffinella frigidus]